MSSSSTSRALDKNNVCKYILYILYITHLFAYGTRSDIFCIYSLNPLSILLLFGILHLHGYSHYLIIFWITISTPYIVLWLLPLFNNHKAVFYFLVISCATALVINEVYCITSQTLYDQLEPLFLLLRHLVHSQINGAQGEATNTDDFDYAQRKRNHKEARNRLHKRPGNKRAHRDESLEPGSYTHKEEEARAPQPTPPPNAPSERGGEEVPEDFCDPSEGGLQDFEEVPIGYNPLLKLLDFGFIAAKILSIYIYLFSLLNFTYLREYIAPILDMLHRVYDNLAASRELQHTVSVNLERHFRGTTSVSTLTNIQLHLPLLLPGDLPHTTYLQDEFSMYYKATISHRLLKFFRSKHPGIRNSDTALQILARTWQDDRNAKYCPPEVAYHTAVYYLQECSRVTWLAKRTSTTQMYPTA